MRSISWQEYLDWQAYDHLEHFTDRDDWRSASVCAAIANFAMITRGSRRRFATKDFLLEFQEPTPTKEGSTAPAAAAQPNEDWKRLKMIAMLHVAASDEDRKRRQRGRSRK